MRTGEKRYARGKATKISTNSAPSAERGIPFSIIAGIVRYDYGYSDSTMTFSQTIGNISYTFGSLCELLAKAKPLTAEDSSIGGQE